MCFEVNKLEAPSLTDIRGGPESTSHPDLPDVDDTGWRVTKEAAKPLPHETEHASRIANLERNRDDAAADIHRALLANMSRVPRR